MSSNDLSERERRILDASGMSEDREVPPDTDEVLGEVRRLEAEIRRRDETIEQLRAGFQQFKQDTNKRIARLEAELDDEVAAVGGTLLEKKASMPRDLRKDTLSSSQFRATVIHNHWETLSWTAGDADNRKYLVNTSRRASVRHKPSKFKLDLEREIGEDLESIEVYRAMKTVARLSAASREDVFETKDAADRLHITGGDYEYHERTTADYSDVKKVLVEVTS